MLVHARRFSNKFPLPLMAFACLRLPFASHAFLLSNTHTARTAATAAKAAAAAAPRALMGKQSAAMFSRSRRASTGVLCSTARRSLLLPSARPRRLAQPHAGASSSTSAASSSSAAGPPDHASSPTAPEAPAGAAGGSAPAAAQGVDQQPAKASTAAASAVGGGQGFGAAPAKKPGAEQQQQQQQQQQQRRKQPRQAQPKAQPKAPPRGNNLLVVGLGNPGDKYRMTRHNAGFLVAEELARRYGGTLKIKTAFQGEYCSVTVKGRSVGILRPITYMNNSGMAARKVMDFFKLPTNAAIVLVDEVALDFGQLRLKGKGGAGGHNGLKSLQSHLKTPDYTRLRIGVGASKFSEALSDHVLGEFTRTEKKELDSVVAEACDAVEHWIEQEDMAKVMTQVNSPR